MLPVLTSMASDSSQRISSLFPTAFIYAGKGIYALCAGQIAPGEFKSLNYKKYYNNNVHPKGVLK
jgi:hypothetical protein